MSLERRIKKLNVILRRELGENPLYGWQHSDSSELSYPMLVYTKDESEPDGVRQLYDYHCQCGRNVTIHTPWCKSLTVPVPKVERKPMLDAPDCRNSWCLCTLMFPDRAEWQSAYGTTVQYPSNGQWMAVSSGATTMMLPHHQIPDEELTHKVIRMIRESRSITPLQWTALWQRESEQRERKHEGDQRDRIADILSGSSRPGKKNEKSYPSAVRLAG